MMASAALEDTEHNRLVMAFTEKRLLRVIQMTHRKYYKRVQKKLTTEDALNPLLERWLRCECDGLVYDDAFDAFFDVLAPASPRDGSLRTGLALNKPGPVTESTEMRDVLELEAPSAEARGARAVTESAEKKPERKSLRGGGDGTAGASSRSRLAGGASMKSSRLVANKLASKSTAKGFFANMDNVTIGKPSTPVSRARNAGNDDPLRVDPKAGARFARSAEADSDDVVDLQFEADIWNERDYNGRVHFLRKEGYFDDLHREWDKHDDAEQAQKDLKELADDPEGAGDVEGGAVLPWHFKEADLEEEEEPAPEEIFVPDDESESEPEPDDPKESPAQREAREERREERREAREARREVIERERELRERTRARHACCIHLHAPGEVCSHGNVMADPEVITELIEREYGAGDVSVANKKIEVKVSLSDTGEDVRRRVYEEMRYAGEEGFYDDGTGDGVPEVLSLAPEQINVVHKGRAVREATALRASHVAWRADVTLQGKRGGYGRSAATLVLRDDLSKLGDGSHTSTVVHHHTNTVVNTATHTEKQISERRDRVAREVGRGARVEFKPQHTVADLRRAAGEARGIAPIDRVILRYNDGKGKELINDAATLERKKVFGIEEVLVEEEVEDPRFVYHEIRKHLAFFETCFKTYASLAAETSRTESSDARATRITTQLLMSKAQFVRMCRQMDVAGKLSQSQARLGDPDAPVKRVFDAAKARANVAARWRHRRRSRARRPPRRVKLNRLARRTEEPVTGDALAFDEFLTAVVMLSWLTYGFRVPQTWTRGVARATRFFVERVMRVGVADVQASHEVLMQFAAARQAEGASPGAAKEAMVAYRRFAFDPERGVSLARWRECVAWLAEPGNVAAETYAVLVFRTHVGGYRGEPPWLEEGCRFGAVEPIGEDPWELLEAELMKFARCQVAFCEMSFRVEAARGGSPRERQMRAFRRAMQREDISRDAKSVDSAEKGEKDKVMRMYDPDYVPTSESETTVIERETTREVHEKEEEEETVEDVPDVGESWVPVSKLNKFKEAARAAKAAAALGRKAPAPEPARLGSADQTSGCRRVGSP